jgi:ribonuclease E
MSRQRLRPSLGESSHIVCPRCVGIGSIRSVESMTLAVLRLIGEELRKDRTTRVIAQVPVSVATYLINEKREWLRTLEDKSEAELIIVPNENIQTPEYSIKRVRDDEMELPEQRQATYLMPTAPEVAEPGTQDRKPPPEAPAVAPLLPATSAPVAVQAVAAAPAVPTPAHGSFWSRVKKILAGEPAATAAPEPAPEANVSPAARAPRRDEGERREGRRERSRYSRHADGARRDRDGRREGRDRDRGRDHGDRDRNRERGRRHEAAAERGGERVAERSGDRNGIERQAADRRNNGDRNTGEAPRQETAGAMTTTPPPVEGRSERAEGRGRGRRGRRRGRRGGGGGAREGAAGTPEMTAATAFGANEEATPGNGQQDAPAPQAEREATEPAARESRPEAGEPAAREFHAEPRTSGGSQESVPLAHFEPSPRPEAGTTPNKPYVVWSSTPSQKDTGPRGSEE